MDASMLIEKIKEIIIWIIVPLGMVCVLTYYMTLPDSGPTVNLATGEAYGHYITLPNGTTNLMSRWQFVGLTAFTNFVLCMGFSLICWAGKVVFTTIAVKDEENNN
jgi:hypothetical protein